MNLSTTWRIKSGLAKWLYSLSDAEDKDHRRSLSDPRFRSKWLAKRVERALNALNGFARPQNASVYTHRYGEDSFTSRLAEPGAQRDLVEYLCDTSDVSLVEIELTLLVLDIGDDGEPLEAVISLGGYLLIWVDLNEEGNLDTNAASPIWLALSLNADIHSPITWGEVRDNRELAGLNGPRLETCLRLIEQTVPAVFMEVDADDYKDVIGPYGFLLPEPT